MIFFENNPLHLQKRLLDLITPAWRQGYPALPVHHPMPGKIVFSGTGMQDSGNLPGSPWIAGMSGYPAIGCHLAGRNLHNAFFDSIGK